MRNFIFLLFPFMLTGCLVWELMPSYSSYWDEDIWIHKNTKQPLNRDIDMDCFNKSLEGFEIKNISGLPRVVGEDNRAKSEKIYASCLRRKGFIFNASYKYCYKFREICDRYNEYRK